MGETFQLPRFGHIALGFENDEVIGICTCSAGFSKTRFRFSGFFGRTAIQRWGPLSLLTRPRRDSPTLIEHVVTAVSDLIRSDQITIGDIRGLFRLRCTFVHLFWDWWVRFRLSSQYLALDACMGEYEAEWLQAWFESSNIIPIWVQAQSCYTIIMAAITHVASAPYSSLSISQNSTDSTMTGLHLSQPAPSPFESTQPAHSSQTTISPTSRGHQQIMPLNMTSYGPANGHHLQPATPRGLADINGHVNHQIYSSNYRPQIYTVSPSSY